MSDQVNRLKAMVIFAWKVRQGGEWDPKPKLVAKFGDVPTTYENRLQEGGPAYYYDVWGNIEYGYLGTASAFSGDALLEG
ncbi:MAG: polymorphic toxin type 44 domain-containing protein, partial [Anaerolineae bacterium]